MSLACLRPETVLQETAVVWITYPDKEGAAIWAEGYASYLPKDIYRLRPASAQSHQVVGQASAAPYAVGYNQKSGPDVPACD